jgi:putative transposase
LGNPVKLLLSGGNRADITQAEDLIDDVSFEVLLADKGYHSQALEEYLTNRGIDFCCPSKSNSLKKRNYDKHLYKERNLVERFFNLLKQFRRVATRYEKTSQNYLAMIQFASCMILLR